MDEGLKVLKKEYKKVCDESGNDNEFGHNCEFDFWPVFKNLYNLVDSIKFVDYCEIDVELPQDDYHKSKALLFIINQKHYCLS